MLESFLFLVWLVCRVIMTVLIVIFLVSGIDNLFVDLVYSLIVSEVNGTGSRVDFWNPLL